MRIWRAVFLASLAAVLGGCAANSGGESAEEEAGAVEGAGAVEEAAAEVRPAVALTEAVLLGEISYVNRDGGFVLIDTTATPNLNLGEKLEVRTVEGAPAGELILSPERKRSYLIGDIISGYPQVADRVYFQQEVFPEMAEEKERVGD